MKRPIATPGVYATAPINRPSSMAKTSFLDRPPTDAVIHHPCRFIQEFSRHVHHGRGEVVSESYRESATVFSSTYDLQIPNQYPALRRR
jgi:hypothetical protein